jgi:transcriptional regulator with XRE-family HTH domain
MSDHTELARFLRARREALRPADVGLPTTSRRRTPGLRREEVAMLANISTDYYERLEQARSTTTPSEQLLGSLARALRLSVDERDHLYAVAGHQPPPRFSSGGYVDPGLMHLLDALTATPAMVVDDLSTITAQNPLAIALLGPWANQDGRRSNVVWRWFTDPESRAVYPPDQHAAIGRAGVADLRAGVYRRGNDPVGRKLVADLQAANSEFADLWELGEVAVLQSERKTLLHPHAGQLDVQCDIVLSPGTGNRLLMFRPQPGTQTAEKLDFIRVLGRQEFPAE